MRASCDELTGFRHVFQSPGLAIAAKPNLRTCRVQQPLVVALTQANGLSTMHETVYENRFGFTEPLIEMGATVQLYRECLGALPCRFQQRNFKHSAVIFGPTPLTGRDIEVPDLRGGFSHLIAALTANGPSNVHGISLIDRGYADFRGKLFGLGAKIG